MQEDIVGHRETNESAVPHPGGAAVKKLPSHMLGLDGVRGVAIAMVMAVHFVGDVIPENLGERVVTRVANEGVYGVDLFFVLSGFLITGILFEKRTSAHYFRDFYARRTLRIFPLYYLVLAILFGLWPLLPVPYPESLRVAAHNQAWLWTYTSNVLIATAGTWGVLPFVSHFWSLAVEEHFYLAWPLAIRALSLRHAIQTSIALIVGSVVLRTGCAIAGANYFVTYVLTPCRLDALCTGALLALLVSAGFLEKARRIARSPLVFLLAAPDLVPATHWLGGNALAVFQQTRGLFLALFFGAIVVVAATEPAGSFLGRLFQNRALRFLGKYSYGLYVYHGIIAHITIELDVLGHMTSLTGSRTLGFLLRVVLGVGVSIVVAMASFEYFEKPLLRLKARFDSPPRASGASAS